MSQCISLTANLKSRCKKQAIMGKDLCSIHMKMKNNGKQVKIKNKPTVVMDNTHIVEPEIEEKDTDIECLCCFQKYNPEMMISCGETESMTQRHSMCRECTSHYIENLINERKKLKCVMNNSCNNEYAESTLAKILDEKLMNRYREYRSVDNATRFASILDNYHICPFCSKYGVIVDNAPHNHANNIQTLQCGNHSCEHIWCIKCRKGYHGNEPCNKIYHADTDKIKRIIDGVIDDALIHNCPKCFMKYNKEDGCNLMTCPGCGSYSCYICNSVVIPVNGLKYQHFHSLRATCPLYNTTDLITPESITKGNATYNNNRIVTALKHLIELNRDNKEICDLITNDLASRGYKEFKKVKIVKIVKNTKSMTRVKIKQK